MARTLAILLIGASLAVGGYAQATGRNASDDEILRALLPNGNWAEERNLKQFNRADEIRALTRAQPEAKGWRAINIAYLLAIFDYKYSANRKIIVDKHNGCRKGPYPHTLECWDLVSDLLMGLFRHGDHRLLRPILAMARLPTDGAFSESLDSFYADTLLAQPRVFLGALATFPVKDQHGIAFDAGTTDGSGLTPKELSDARRKLRSIASNRKDPLARVARLCLTEVNKANSQKR